MPNPTYKKGDQVRIDPRIVKGRPKKDQGVLHVLEAFPDGSLLLTDDPANDALGFWEWSMFVVPAEAEPPQEVKDA